jgi:hypothetical protein
MLMLKLPDPVYYFVMLWHRMGASFSSFANIDTHSKCISPGTFSEYLLCPVLVRIPCLSR